MAQVEPGFVYFLKQQQIRQVNGEYWVMIRQNQIVVVIFYTLFLLRATEVCISVPSITTEAWDSARAEETAKNPEEITLSGLPHSCQVGSGSTCQERNGATVAVRTRWSLTCNTEQLLWYTSDPRSPRWDSARPVPRTVQPSI